MRLERATLPSYKQLARERAISTCESEWGHNTPHSRYISESFPSIIKGHARGTAAFIIGSEFTKPMEYRIQFMDGSASVIRELTADTRNVLGALTLVAEIDWPARAVAMRVLDNEGREVHSATKDDSLR